VGARRLMLGKIKVGEVVMKHETYHIGILFNKINWEDCWCDSVVDCDI